MAKDTMVNLVDELASYIGVRDNTRPDRGVMAAVTGDTVLLNPQYGEMTDLSRQLGEAGYKVESAVTAFGHMDAVNNASLANAIQRVSNAHLN